jgi:hypothetical protein
VLDAVVVAAGPCRRVQLQCRPAPPICAPSTQPYPLQQSLTEAKISSLPSRIAIAILRPLVLLCSAPLGVARRRATLNRRPRVPKIHRCVELLLEMTFTVKTALEAMPPSAVAPPLHLSCAPSRHRPALVILQPRHRLRKHCARCPAPPRPVNRLPPPLHRAVVVVRRAAPSWSAVSGELAPLRCSKMGSSPHRLPPRPAPLTSALSVTGFEPHRRRCAMGQRLPLFHRLGCQPKLKWAGLFRPKSHGLSLLSLEF